MKAEINIPTNLSEIPLKNYQEFMKLLEKSNDEEFISHKSIEIFCGLKMNEILKIKWSDVSDLVNHFNKLFKQKPTFQNRFKIGEIEFGFIPNLEEMSFGEYIDLESNITSVETFHKAMAVLYRPITKTFKDTYEIMEYKGTSEFSDLMKYAPMNIVISASLFFWNLGNDLVQTSLTYLEREMKGNKKLQKTIQKELNLTESGDGTIQFMQSLKATLQNLMMLPEWEFYNVSLGLHTNDKKTKLNNENLTVN